MTQIIQRIYTESDVQTLIEAGIDPVFARIFAARGVKEATALNTTLQKLHPPDLLKGIRQAAEFLVCSLKEGKKFLVIADYDCDGATACAVALRGFRLLGATATQINYLVPNRFTDGYGLTPSIVQHALGKDPKPDILITVDNGIASVEGVEAAHQHGMEVVITDHHLAGNTLPAARAIVNPNQPGCPFPSKALSGVGVIFYVLLMMRSVLREQGAFHLNNQPRLDTLLDLVALGTVADVVKLDTNNRILVDQGLKRIRHQRMQAGVAALFKVAEKDFSQASSTDLGFSIGPRLNAAGRLEDMSLGIECLCTDDPYKAFNIAKELDHMNRERRTIETEMQTQAMETMGAALHLGIHETQATICLFDPRWHQGVMGIVAARLKERFHRPVMTFAPADEGFIKGSGRSISGFHLRDAIDWISKQYPDLILAFGGHSAAAGLTIREKDFPLFAKAFEQIGCETLTPEIRTQTLEVDGSLEIDHYQIDFTNKIESYVWGQGFPAPIFLDDFWVHQQTLLKEKHLKLKLERHGQYLNAIWFNHPEYLAESVQLAYRLAPDKFRGEQSIQLIIQAEMHI